MNFSRRCVEYFFVSFRSWVENGHNVYNQNQATTHVSNSNKSYSIQRHWTMAVLRPYPNKMFLSMYIVSSKRIKNLALFTAHGFIIHASAILVKVISTECNARMYSSLENSIVRVDFFL